MILAKIATFNYECFNFKRKMSSTADLKWIQEEIKNLDDPDLIDLIKKILMYRTKSAETSLNQALDEAHQDLMNGRTTPHDEVRKKYEKWL